MVNLYKNSVNGEPIEVVKRTWIFKDGVFSIQPTLNNFTVIKGILTNGSQLSIPYKESNKTVYVKIFNKQDGSIVFSTKATGVSSTDYQNVNVLNVRHNNLLNTLKLFGLESENYIYLGFSTLTMADIIEIWTEEVVA